MYEENVWGEELDRRLHLLANRRARVAPSESWLSDLDFRPVLHDQPSDDVNQRAVTRAVREYREAQWLCAHPSRV
jgi:hypothetical protein